jgi:Ser/Thr protein kinase RdoA (MazF antagonist)
MEQAITHSILSAEALGAEIAQTYPSDTPETCQLLLPSKNDTYLVTTGGHRYIARVYRARWRSWSEISYELELLTHLAAKGIPVSVPIPARDGTLIRPLLAPEGTRYLVLFTYAKETHFPLTEEEHCYLAGRLLAALHTASDDFVSRQARCRLDLEHLIDRPLTAMCSFLDHRADDWRYLERLAGKLRARVETVAAGLDWGVCHGDFAGGNIHVAEDRTLTVFDFDFCGPGWRAYDLAAIQSIAVGPDKTTLWEGFLQGYTEIRRLAPTDLAAVPFFHAIRHLWGMGVQASNVADRGILRLNDGAIDSELSFFRQWEADHPVGY